MAAAHCQFRFYPPYMWLNRFGEVLDMEIFYWCWLAP